MSWRRFATLLRGLGPLSGTVQRSQIRHLSRESKVRTITDPKEINDAFATLFGGGRKVKPVKH